MNQTISWTAFGTGLTAFVGVAGEIVTEHTTWHDFTTPLGVLHLFVLGAAFMTMLGGALGAQLPRTTNHGQRATDQKPGLPSDAPPPGTIVTETKVTETKTLEPKETDR